MLPTDVVVNAGFPAGDTPVAPEVVAADAIPADKMGLDIGPDSQKLFHDKIVDSKTVVWNGPMGVFEVPEFAAGTKAVAQGLVDATAAGAFTIVGGGDSASPCATSASRRTASRTSPPVAAPPLSSLRARSCRG